MPSPIVWRGPVWEDATFLVEGQLVDSRGVLLTTSTVTSWSVKVYSQSDTSNPIYTLLNQSPDGNIFNSLQPWSRSAEGKNFEHKVLGGAFSMAGGRSYRMEYEFLSTEDGAIPMIVIVTAKSRLSV